MLKWNMQDHHNSDGETCKTSNWTKCTRVRPDGPCLHSSKHDNTHTHKVTVVLVPSKIIFPAESQSLRVGNHLHSISGNFMALSKMICRTNTRDHESMRKDTYRTHTKKIQMYAKKQMYTYIYTCHYMSI